jgi:uncharacterized protein YndB with AHSA1/START domain
MHTISVSILTQAPQSAVWDALTLPELVQKYFFGTHLATDWRVGSPVTFRGEWNGQLYEDRGTVLSFEPRRRLSYDYWSSMSGEADVVQRRPIITFELVPEDGGVRLTVQQSNIATEERAEHSAKNWQLVLDGLKRVVEGD